MSGKNPRLNPLESRKQLLVAESELNRAQVLEDMAVLTADVRVITGRAKSFSALAASAAMLVTGLAAWRGAQPAGAKPSWWKSILKGAGLLSTVWLAFRAKGRTQQNT